MPVADRYCHTASSEVAVPAEVAFDYMSDGIKQGEWTLGSWNRRQRDDGLFVGESLFDGKETYIRIDADRGRLLVDYFVGRDPERLAPRNSARIVRGSSLGRGDDTCVVTLLTWRGAETTDEGWERTCLSHETELFMIKGRLELGFQV
jgi:hypothetical protein